VIFRMTCTPSLLSPSPLVQLLWIPVIRHSTSCSTEHESRSEAPHHKSDAMMHWDEKSCVHEYHGSSCGENCMVRFSGITGALRRA
jgi:hypothetical protein